MAFSSCGDHLKRMSRPNFGRRIRSDPGGGARGMLMSWKYSGDRHKADLDSRMRCREDAPVPGQRNPFPQQISVCQETQIHGAQCREQGLPETSPALSPRSPGTVSLEQPYGHGCPDFPSGQHQKSHPETLSCRGDTPHKGQNRIPHRCGDPMAPVPQGTVQLCAGSHPPTMPRSSGARVELGTNLTLLVP